MRDAPPDQQAPAAGPTPRLVPYPSLVLHGEAAGDTLWLVDSRGILGGLVVLAIAVWNGVDAVALVAGMFVALALVARGWSRLALGGLRCTLSFHDDRAFPDDELDLVLSIENRWLIPIPWLEAELTLPHRLYPLGGTVRRLAETEARVIHVLATVLPFRRLTWRHRLRCRTRGLYEIRSVWVMVSDPLRLFPRRIELLVDARLIVYPRIAPLEQLGFRSWLPQGDRALRTVLLDDPLRPIGVRDYRPGDPLRRVHWKASARRQQLQIKVLERTARLQLALYLGVDGFDHPWVVYRDALFERTVTATASLAWFAVQHGGRVGLALSGAKPSYLPAASGPQHLREILEALAVVAPRRGRPLESLLAASSARQPAGTTIVALVAALSDELIDELRIARGRGYPVAVVRASVDSISPATDFDFFELGRDRDLARVMRNERLC